MPQQRRPAHAGLAARPPRMRAPEREPRETAPPAPVRTSASRRTQRDRTREARARLLAATIAVLVERGYVGLTTKEVATRAGFSSGALVHHYGTKADLVIAATDDIYAQATRLGERIAAAPGARRDPLGAFVEDCWGVYLDRPFIAAIEVLVLARTEPTLMAQIEPIMQRYRATTNARWLHIFEGRGLSRAEAANVLVLTLNLVRGFAVNSLWQRDDAHYRSVVREWIATARERWPALALGKPGDAARKAAPRRRRTRPA